MDNAMRKLPNVPAEKFETLLLEAVCGEVLSEDRVSTIFDDCAANVDALQGKEGGDIDRPIKAKTETQRRLADLYKLVEDGFDQNEDSLEKRLRAHHKQLQALTVKIEDLKVKVLAPKTSSRRSRSGSSGLGCARFSSTERTPRPTTSFICS